MAGLFAFYDIAPIRAWAISAYPYGGLVRKSRAEPDAIEGSIRAASPWRTEQPA
jgi:hypothetical protein